MKRGFTLLETIVFITLSSMITIAIAGLTVFFYRTNASIIEQAGAIASARRGIENAIKDLREATYAETGAYPIESISENTIIFYADIDLDNAVEKVRYELINETLYKHVVDPSGDPPNYTGTSATTTISTNVRNLFFEKNIFTYFDSSGNELSASSSPVDVAFITATIIVNINPDRAPEEFTLTSSATLRNLRAK